MENQKDKFNKSIDQNSNNRVVSSDEKTNKVEKISLDEIKKAKEELKGEDSSKNQTQQKNDSNKFDSFKEQLEKLRGESTSEKKEPEKPEKKTKFDWDSISFDEPEKKPSETKTEEPEETFNFNWDSVSLDEEKKKTSETQKTKDSEETFKFNWNSVSLDDLNDTEKPQEVQQEVTESEQTSGESDTQIFATVAGDHDFDKLHIKLQIDPDTNIGTILTDPEAIAKLDEKEQEKETKKEEPSKEIEKETISKEPDDVRIQIEKQEKTPEIQEKTEIVEKTIPVEQKHEPEVQSQTVQENEEKPLKEETPQTQTLSLEEIERIRNELLNKKPNQEVSEPKENLVIEEKAITEEKPIVEEKPQNQEEVQKTISEEHVQKVSQEEIERLRNELHGNNGSNSVETKTSPVVEKNVDQEKNENLLTNEKQENEQTQNQVKEQENAEETKSVQETKTDEQTVEKNKQNVSSIDESLFNDEDFEGMTDEEIVQEIERRKRLADLKQKYSEDNNKDPNDIGEYKKSLDFASNATIKHFKMRPPKRVVASIIISIFLAIAVAITTTLLVLKKPPEPATLVSSRISQTKISHYVGETIDLRGIYIEELYSDGSKQTVQVSSSIITEKSSNINNDLVVVEFSENAYIRFTLNGKTQSLFVELDEMKIENISVLEVYPTNYVAESKIKFDTILIMAEITNKDNVVIGEKRIDPRNVTFRIEGQEGNLEIDNEGVLLYKTDGSNKILLEEGDYTLVVVITENNVDFEKTIKISIS